MCPRLMFAILWVILMTVISSCVNSTMVNSGTATSATANSTIQRSIFNDIWQIIESDYLYAKTQQRELNLVKSDYEKRLGAGLSRVNFYAMMIAMVESLGDNHSQFAPPPKIGVELCRYPLTYGHGIFYVPLLEDRALRVIDIWLKSPADNADIKGYDTILEINGQSALQENNKIRCIRPDQNIELLIRTPAENNPKKVTLRTVNAGFPYQVRSIILNAQDGKKVGYIRILGFDRYTPDYFRHFLTTVMETPDVIGLIIDDRVNLGGEHGYLKNILSFFIHGKQGYYESQSEHFPTKPFDIPALQNINGSSSIPLAVLVGPETQSSGEIFAGILQNSGRAYIIGEKTEGNAEGLQAYDLSDGSTLSLSVLRIVPNNPDLNWEKTGIIPDKTVHFDWKHYFNSDDPVINAAIEYFEELTDR
jgi:C-terminal processing protease CtpA/Prc